MYTQHVLLINYRDIPCYSKPTYLQFRS